MNQIVSLNPTSTFIMSSREIAKLTGKRHDHGMRDIRNMLSGLQINDPNFGGVYIDTKGETLSCFNLPKRETLILSRATRSNSVPASLIAGWNWKSRSSTHHAPAVRTRPWQLVPGPNS